MRASATARAALLLLLLPGCTLPGLAPIAPPSLDPDLVQRGAFLYRDASVSGDGTRSCNSCHPGGGSNGRVYRDGEEVEPGSRDARLTPSLRGVWQTAPYLWDGSLADLRAALSRMLALEMRASALAGRDREALLAYLGSIPVFDRGRIGADGTPVEPATLRTQRGFELFRALRCDQCHRPPAFTRPRLDDVGTGGAWSVPTLRGVSQAARLGHDGRWSRLSDAVDAMLAARGHELSAEKLAQLMAYLELL